jgi:hypothetical protein
MQRSFADGPRTCRSKNATVSALSGFGYGCNPYLIPSRSKRSHQTAAIRRSYSRQAPRCSNTRTRRFPHIYLQRPETHELRDECVSRLPMVLTIGLASNRIHRIERRATPLDPSTREASSI